MENFLKQTEAKRFGQRAFFWYLEEMARQSAKGTPTEQITANSLLWIAGLKMNEEERKDFEDLVSHACNNFFFNVEFKLSGDTKAATIEFNENSKYPLIKLTV